MRTWRIISILAVATALFFAAQAAFADEPDAQGPQGQDLIVARNGRGIVQVRKISNTVAQARADTTYGTLISTVVNVPVGGASFFDMRFSAESACYAGGTDTDWCTVRILVNGVEANPVVGTDFAFDSTDGGRETSGSWESHAMERYTNCLQPGNYSVIVQWASVNLAGAIPTFRLDDWTLAIERVQGCV